MMNTVFFHPVCTDYYYLQRKVEFATSGLVCDTKNKIGHGIFYKRSGIYEVAQTMLVRYTNRSTASIVFCPRRGQEEAVFHSPVSIFKRMEESVAH